MRALAWSAWLLLAALGLGLAVRGGERVGLESSASPYRRVPDGLHQRLANVPGPLLITYLTTPEHELPPDRRGQRASIEEALRQLVEASQGRLKFQVEEPQGEGEALWRALGAEPFRARLIERDGWREQLIWSHLGISVGDQPTRWLTGLRPESVARAAAWIVVGCEEAAAPRPARLALAGDIEAAAKLWEGDAGVDLTLVEDPAQLAQGDSDLLLWIAPRNADAPWLAALQEHLARGRSAVVAAAPWPLRTTDESLFFARPEASGLEAVFAHFGVDLGREPLLDPISDVLQRPGFEQPLPWRVRSLASAHDFRSLGREPGGPILFEGTRPLVPDPTRVLQAGRQAHVLASSSTSAWSVAGDDREYTLADLLQSERTARTPATLMLHLESTEGEGQLVLAGSATPWLEPQDEFHERLVRGMLRDLVSYQARVRSQVLPLGRAVRHSVDSSQRWLWQGGFALLAAGLALGPRLRRRASQAAHSQGSGLRWTVAGLLWLAFALGLGRLSTAGVDVFLDATRRQQHALPARTAQALDQLKSELEITLELSPAGTFPGSWRAGRERLVRFARNLSRGRSRVRLQEVEVDPQVGGVTVRSEDGSWRRLFAALRVRYGSELREVRFEETSAFERADLRLALALEDLVRGSLRSVVVAADVPRLSPAEALLQYQRAGRFAPTEGDAYARARTLLQETGLSVRSIDPAKLQAAEGSSNLEPDEVLVWLQPRREIGPMLALLQEHLAAGGSALVAAQHFDIDAVRLDGPKAPLRFWPRPLFPDLDQEWLPSLGVQFERRILLDERDVRGAEDVTQAAAGRRTFQLREAAEQRPEHPWNIGLGDLSLPGASAFTWDEASLTARGLQARSLWNSSRDAWSYQWEGGALPRTLLAGRTEALAEGNLPEPERVRGEESPRVLALELSGDFGDNGAAGRCLLLGSSLAFQDEAIEAEGYANANLLVSYVLGLATRGDASPADLIALQGPVAPGLPDLLPQQRLRLRVLTTLAGPALVFLAWALGRRRGGANS